jgi:DNA (cytosine-5)-methyltransferase 1
MRMKAASLFAGIGGFCAGFNKHGFETVWANDNDRVACSIYRHNFPGVRVIEKDVTDLNVKKDELEPVDVLHAGFPCQSFSQAGPKTGFDDDRGQLFFQILRIVKQFENQKPKVLVLENAPYLKIGDGGRWFMEITERLQKAGYWFRGSNAVELDLYDVSDRPQQRRRLFLIAFSRDHFRSGRITVPTSIENGKTKEMTRFVDFSGEQEDRYYLDEQNRYFEMIKKEYKDTRGDKYIYQLRKYLVRQKNLNFCPTLTANMGMGGHNVPFVWDKKGLRKLTEAECLKLQGFPDWFSFPEGVSAPQQYMKIGNSVAPPVADVVAKAVRHRITERKE